MFVDFFAGTRVILLLEPGVSFATIKFVRVYDLWEFYWNQSNFAGTRVMVGKSSNH